MLNTGTHTNHGWLLKVWTATDPPPSGPHQPAYLCSQDKDRWGWYWAEDVEATTAPGRLPAVKVPRGWKTRLAVLLAPYGGNRWIQEQIGMSKRGVVLAVGNRLWPPAREVKRWKRLEDAAIHFGVSIGVIRRVMEADARGYSVYGGKPVPSRPEYARR